MQRGNSIPLKNLDKGSAPNEQNRLAPRNLSGSGPSRHGDLRHHGASQYHHCGLDREHLLRKALEVLSPGYDFIFVDCPPSLELLTVNALCAADSLLVPVQCEYYALEGLSDLLSTVRLVKRSLNPRLVLEGVLLTMFDSRTNLSLQVAEEVKRHFPGQVYATVIPRNVRLSEAPSHGKPVTAYDPYSRGAEAYRLLAEEIAAKHPTAAPV